MCSLCLLFTGVFLRGVLASLAENAWSPVPGLYWAAALASLRGQEYEGCWDNSSLFIVNNLISTGCTLSERRLRQATQLYLAIAALNLSQVLSTLYNQS